MLRAHCVSQATTSASRARGPLGCLVTALLALGCSPDPGFVRDAARPNVLIVTLDTTRPDRLGCYGHSVATSPELDRLCADAGDLCGVVCLYPDCHFLGY